MRIVSLLPPPNTQTHSVAAGNSETMRMADSCELRVSGCETPTDP